MNSSSYPGASAGDAATSPLFREVQRFQQWVFLVPILGVAGIVWWEFAQQVVLGHPQGTNPIPNWLAWVLAIVFGLGFPALALGIRLVTEVRPGELTVRLVPFRGAVISLQAVQEAVVRQYSPIKEYGGWGIRMNKWNGRAYNAYGNRGVQLVLTDGALVLIGSQQPEQLLAALLSAGADIDQSGRGLDKRRSARRTPK